MASSLSYLRGESKIKLRNGNDRRLLCTQISELSEQTKLDVVEAVTFQCLNARTKQFAKKINKKMTSQEILDVC